MHCVDQNDTVRQLKFNSLIETLLNNSVLIRSLCAHVGHYCCIIGCECVMAACVFIWSIFYCILFNNVIVTCVTFEKQPNKIPKVQFWRVYDFSFK